MVDCILVDRKFKKNLRTINSIVYKRSNYNETYAWKLENIKKYDKVIPATGKLGLWNYNMEEENVT